ncbi:Na+/H+ antiporter NhaC family protein [Paremcibacter congregatus]|uniref:Sodium:proton antiporter n=1 Tax=Paremcibacter congregatus TaxID=2043170 RepID=A0A2G4YQQ7_9PROT|nr:Na+/H+ antiporter NhaC family protein [Paremcibacter congregatus]PHZ84663.1 sodium:proton antiporter [Paremcibacter congregatus]QDE28859.1 sodium:proton antiporter [Paremcibacter congregatus]
MEALSVLPPLVAIFIVVWRKEVILALFLAILTSELLLVASPGVSLPLMGLLNSLERVTTVFTDAGNSRILIFSLMIGALLAFIRVSGGMTAMVGLLINSGLARGQRSVSALTSLTGMVVFIESNLSVLTAGILSRGLFDKYGMSRARLAYIIDSTSAPVCILILLNGWGAYILALLAGYDLKLSPAEILWGTVPLNFYALVTLAIVFYTAYTGRVHGPLKAAEARMDTGDSSPIPEHAPTKARFMVVPLLVMVLGMVSFMYWTGDGDLSKGSGSKSVLYATALACLTGYIMMLMSGKFGHSQLVKISFDGMGELLPLVTIVLFSLALGASLKQLGTGIFIAGLVGDFLPLYLVVPMLFIAGGLMSFTTGTSWGTFAILIPLGVPLINELGLPPSLVLSAIMGGGVFGDHCSPISDTTAVSAIASGCDLLEHVRTQLPYALTAGGISLILYIIASLVLL